MTNETTCPICMFGTIQNNKCDTCETEFCATCTGTTAIKFSNPRRHFSCTCKRNVRTVPEFPCYRVHRDGRVFRVQGQLQHIGELLPRIAPNGYVQITLRHMGRKEHFWLHRLVCAAFNGEPPWYGEETAHCRHLDGDRTNNHADNLRWGSRVENERDKKRFYGPLVTRT